MYDKSSVSSVIIHKYILPHNKLKQLNLRRKYLCLKLLLTSFVWEKFKNSFRYNANKQVAKI